jgi:hypothetical protein
MNFVAKNFPRSNGCISKFLDKIQVLRQGIFRKLLFFNDLDHFPYLLEKIFML